VEGLWIYITVVAAAGLLSFFLCCYSYFKIKDAPGATSYTLVTLLSTFFTFSYVFELKSTSLVQIKFWVGMEYLALPFIPPFILLMCFEYIGKKISVWLRYVLFTIPLVTIFMHSTNDLHHFYYTTVSLRADAPFPVANLEHGPFFYLHSFFMFACIVTGAIVLLIEIKKAQLRFKIQLLLMAFGLLVPMVANYCYLNGISSYGIDLGPISMSISFLFHGIALFMFQMFNVAPIARDWVFESLQEGVIVLNQQTHIVDYNQKMMSIIPALSKCSVGTSVLQIVGDNVNLLCIMKERKDCDYKVIQENKEEYFHVRFSTIQNQQGFQVGFIVTFSNITERVVLQKKLQHLASIDGLTGVLNRTFFMQKAKAQFLKFQQHGGQASIIMFDVDRFKSVNDTFGHEAGDAVLTCISKIAKDALINRGFIGRYGGEEFIIYIPDVSFVEAYE
jgi:PAS domain-containing protein